MTDLSRKYELRQRVTKIKGSQWTGIVVGFYSTQLTPIGYAVESETEVGSVQIYPEAALRDAPLTTYVEECNRDCDCVGDCKMSPKQREW